jgi:hypothetical protein
LQITPAHGLATQPPLTQSWPVGQLTPAHGLGGTHSMSHAWPAGHIALQLVSAWHRPAEQYWPLGHTTPAHGFGKQPATQVPPMQVSRF